MPVVRPDKYLLLNNHISANYQSSVYDEYGSWNFYLTDKPWLDLQFHDLSRTQIKKPEEIEDHMKKPPTSIDKTILNRIAGSMLGLALVSEEWSQHRIPMIMCLANSLIVSQIFNLYDQLVRYKWYYRHGYMSSIGSCLDIGIDTRKLIENFERHQQSFAQEYHIPMSDMDSLSNPQLLEKFKIYSTEERIGSDGDELIRLTPVSLFFFRYPSIAIEYADQNCRLTCTDIKVIDACRYYSALIVAALHNYSKDQLLDDQFIFKHRSWFKQIDLHTDIVYIAQGSYKTKSNNFEDASNEISTIHMLKNALWVFWSTETFEEGLLVAIHMGHGRNSVAVIYSQLAGAFYGQTSLPDSWLDGLYAKKFISILAEWLTYEGQRWYSICLPEQIKNPMTTSEDMLASQEIKNLSQVSETPVSDFNCLIELMEDDGQISQEKIEQAADQINHWVRRLPCDLEMDGMEYIYHHNRYEIFLKQIQIVERIRQHRQNVSQVEIERINSYERKKMMERLGKLKRQMTHDFSDSITIVRGWYGCTVEEMFDITNDGFSQLMQLGPGDNDRGFCLKSSTKAAAEDAGSNGCVLMCYMILRNPFPTIIGQTSTNQSNNRYRYYSDGIHRIFQETKPTNISLPYHEIFYGFYDEFVTDQSDDILPQVVIYLRRQSSRKDGELCCCCYHR